MNQPVPGISAFISPGRSLPKTLERVALADQLGYDAVYTTHIAGRDSLTVLMAYAAASERIKLGTGVVPIFSRTPATMAQTAATIDEYSNGRMVLGLGVSHRVTVENWHGQKITKPVSQMREYLAGVRAILGGTEPPDSEHFPTKFAFMGYSGPGRAADLRRRAVAEHDPPRRRAGRRGDALALLSVLHREHRDSGLEARASRPRGARSTTSTSSPRCPMALTDDPEAARATLRQDLIPYASLPFYRAMLEASGFADELAAFDEGMAAGDLDRAKAGLSDRMLSELAGIGDKAEVHAAVERYRAAGANSPGIGGMPGTDFDAALEAVAELI